MPMIIANTLIRIRVKTLSMSFTVTSTVTCAHSLSLATTISSSFLISPLHLEHLCSTIREKKLPIF